MTDGPTEAPKRRIELDVHMHAPAPSAPPAPRRWPRERRWVLAAAAALSLACFYAWHSLAGHPIAVWLAALPQVSAALGTTVLLLSGGDAEAAKSWQQRAASSLVALVDRRARWVCGALLLATLAVVYLGSAMQSLEILCPPGGSLSYGSMGARVPCDGPDVRVWMPLGDEEAARTFRCSVPGASGSWRALRRRVRDDDGAPAHVVSCYEDGGRVVGSYGERELAYLEYGWGEQRPIPTIAPCDHLPPGLYHFEASTHNCEWLGEISVLSQLFESAYDSSDPRTRDAVRRLTNTDCAGCPESDATSPPDPESPQSPPACPPPRATRFAFFHPEGCRRDFGRVDLHITDRDVDLGIGISFRQGMPRRCVPPAARRDGYLHVFLPNGELVFAVARDEPRELLLVEDVRTTTPPAALARECPR